MSAVLVDAWSRLAAFACRVVLRCLVRLRIEGLEHAPRDGALIIAVNHISNADPPLVGGWLTPALGRRPRFLAKDTLFVGIVGWFLRSQGVVPVRSGGSDVEAYRVARDLLSRGEVLIIFPEGTRSRDGVLSRPLPGVSLLATRLGVPILPVGISGTDAFLRRGSRLPRLGVRVTLRVGEPFHLVADPALTRREALKATDQELMRHIAALVEPRHRGGYTPWSDGRTDPLPDPMRYSHRDG